MSTPQNDGDPAPRPDANEDSDAKENSDAEDSDADCVSLK